MYITSLVGDKDQLNKQSVIFLSLKEKSSYPYIFSSLVQIYQTMNSNSNKRISQQVENSVL